MLSKQMAQMLVLFKVIAERFIKDRFTYSAAALTYTTLLAIVPLMAIGFTILSAFPVFNHIEKQMQAFIFSNFIPTKGEVIQQYLTTFTGQAAQLSIIGMIFLLVTAILTMLTIERALNDVWQVQHRRQGISAWLRYWAILSLGPVFVGLSIATTTYVISIPFIEGAVARIGLNNLLTDVLPVALSIIGFTLLYVVVPSCRVPWRFGLIGAVAASILLAIVRKIFVFYVSGFNTYELLYGALAIIPIFLLWIYLVWVIILFGALVSQVLATHYFSRWGGRFDGFMHAFLWLGCLWQAQQQGKSLSLAQLYRLNPGHYDIHPQQQLRKLQQANLISVTQAGDYILTRDLTALSLADLYHLLPWRLPNAYVAIRAETKFATAIKQTQVGIDQQMSIPLSVLYQDYFKLADSSGSSHCASRGVN